MEGLQALEGLNNGVEVLIGNNPIAANLTNRRIQPHCVPNCHPGTVASSADIYGSMTVPITARNPKAAGEAGASAEKDLLRSSTVTIRVKRNVPDRPSLAKSLTCGLNTVNSSMAECMQDLTRGAVTFQGLTHSKIVDVFDQLHQELDNWQLASVAEGQESRERLAESSTEDVDLGDTFMTDVYVPVQVRAGICPDCVRMGRSSEGNTMLDSVATCEEPVSLGALHGARFKAVQIDCLAGAHPLPSRRCGQCHQPIEC